MTMIKHNYCIPFERFDTLLIIYRIKLEQNEIYEVYNIFKEIFRYDTTFTYLDEDTDLIKFSINCKYLVQQICYDLGIL